VIWGVRTAWWRTISGLQRLRKPVSSKRHPPRNVQKNHRVRSHRRNLGGIYSGRRAERVLRWRMVVVLNRPRRGSSVGRRGTCDRESFCCVYYCVEPVYGRDCPKGSRREFKVRVVGAWASERRGVGFRVRYLLSESVPMQTVERLFAAVELTGSHGQPCKCMLGQRLDVGERKKRAWDRSSLVGYENR